jgi:hypothetical protein
MDEQCQSELSLLYPLLLICPTTWLSQLVLGLTIGLFPFNYNSNILINVLVLSVFSTWPNQYVGVLISLWLFLFPAQPKEFFFDGLKKLEQRSHKCVELRGEYIE